MDWFAGCHTVPEIKARYRELAKRHHPDWGGDNETMKAINAAYHAALRQRNGESCTGDDGREHTYRYNEAVEQAVIDKLAAVLALRMQGVRVLLIGTWLWVVGDTRPHKEALKRLGLWWVPKRLAWAYHASPWRGRPNPGSLDSIAWRYGVQEFRAPADEATTADALPAA